MGYEGILSVL